MGDRAEGDGPGGRALAMPTPEDPGRAPVWENYVVAQVAQASLGLVPRNAVALGVRVDGCDLTLLGVLKRRTVKAQEDLEEIVDELEMLLGPRPRVELSVEVLARREIWRHRDVRWTFLARS
ncbi:hypothetical protein [Oerskovia paurometabola]|uniref:Uncharacterized protein n=1 Tax=Oerskovia paurometabola TaxID=162170 RepID=A0ABW1XF59_9CELL|nr:hypothetical protein [Oerskovia paurometabola]MBM7497477.1 hypothetical protein [Oerskovia paurometabola]